MPMNLSPTASALGSDLGFGGDLLTKQREDEEEEQRRRKKLGLSAASYGSPTVQGLLSGMNQFSLGGIR